MIKDEDTAHKGMHVAASNQSIIQKITFIHNILKREEIEVVLSPLVQLYTHGNALRVTARQSLQSIYKEDGLTTT